jgi:hypothetical protein
MDHLQDFAFLLIREAAEDDIVDDSCTSFDNGDKNIDFVAIRNWHSSIGELRFEIPFFDVVFFDFVKFFVELDPVINFTGFNAEFFSERAVLEMRIALPSDFSDGGTEPHLKSD